MFLNVQVTQTFLCNEKPNLMENTSKFYFDFDVCQNNVTKVFLILKRFSRFAVDERTSSCVQWETVDAEQWARGVRISISHFKPVTHVSVDHYVR